MQSVQVGIYLLAIYKNDLYEEAGYGTFREFIENHAVDGIKFPFGEKEAKRRIRVAERVIPILELREDYLAKAKTASPEEKARLTALAPRLPTSQNQILALIDFEPYEALRIWIKIDGHAKATQEDITAPMIKERLGAATREIQATVTEIPPEPKTLPMPAAAFVSPKDSDIDFSDEIHTPTQPRWSAAARRALDRISLLEQAGRFPKGVVNAIEGGGDWISDWDLSTWDSHDDVEFLKMGRLILSEGLNVATVNRSLTRDLKSPNALIYDLAYRAIADGTAVGEIIELKSGKFQVSAVRIKT